MRLDVCPDDLLDLADASRAEVEEAATAAGPSPLHESKALGL